MKARLYEVTWVEGDKEYYGFFKSFASGKAVHEAAHKVTRGKGHITSIREEREVSHVSINSEDNTRIRKHGQKVL